MTAADRICTLLRKAGPLTSKDISVILRISQATVKSALHLLEQAERITIEPSDIGKERNRRWTLTEGAEIRMKLGRIKDETSSLISSQGLSYEGLPSVGSHDAVRMKPTKPNEPEPAPWRRTDVVGKDGANMWLDPDGFHVSVRNMTAELRTRLGITDAVPLPKEKTEPQINPLEDRYLTGPEAAQKVRELKAALLKARRALP